MTHPSLHIQPFDYRNASNDEYAAMLALANRLRAESLPEDPPIPLDEVIKEWRSMPTFVHARAWGIWRADGSAIIARGDTFWRDAEDNKHLVEFRIQVLPEYRRQGLARQLLPLIADATRRANRRLLVTDTNERIPAGAVFLERIGAQQGLIGHMNQLKIAELNRALMQQWIARAQERAGDFEMGFWTGPYPEADLEAVAALLRVMNTAPRENLEIEDFQVTPEQIREYERSMFLRGSSRWTAYVRETATGNFAGFTELVWNPNRAEILEQWGTGVFPEYRNRGLGRWLKAALLDKVLREHPEIKFVRTGNADSNAAMLKINSEMGFKPYLSEIAWQVDIEQVERYLNHHS
ncbi:MAG: GNAT family N-acetyltransferase [Anaerolineales bacterium]|nr:GNAT family N-acetyltransferase [Anaerolineales bacterium]